MNINQFIDNFGTCHANGVGDIIQLHQPIALLVDHLSLFIRDVVIFQQLFSGIKVSAFHLFLRIFYCTGYPTVLDRLTLFHTQLLHQTGYTLGAKNTHQIIFHGKIVPARPGITLAPATTSKLIVHTAGFIAFGS